MSTCQGAPAPHENCPHGDRCDWNLDLRITARDLESAYCERSAHGVCNGCSCQCHKIAALRG